MSTVSLVSGTIQLLLKQKNWPAVYQAYVNFLREQPALLSCYLANLTLIKRRFLADNSVQTRHMGVFCWNTANNALGRAVTLADCYREAGFTVKLLGCVPYPRWRKLWQPLEQLGDEINCFELASHSQLLSASCEFVLQYPLRYLHISKPRLPGVVVAMLYKLFWGADVIIDVDDEEMAFFPGAKSASEANTEINLAAPAWTELAIRLIPAFDAVTVSNSALQQRYGGIAVPHARDAKVFSADNFDKQAQRAALGIPLDKKVILFMGTPREHKGVLETAKALAQLKLNNYVYVIAGNFIDKALEARLLAIENLNLLLLPNQPYDKAAAVVVTADLCVLLQDTQNEAAQFQLPAKLIDAVAMGVPVLLEVTAATQSFADNKLVLPVTRHNLTRHLNDFLAGQLSFPPQKYVRRYFEQNLSVQAMQGVLSEVIKQAAKNAGALPWCADIMQSLVANDVVAFLAACQRTLQRNASFGNE